jgi:hypothetical protein
MRAKGISYDTGIVRNGRNGREHFDRETVRRELEIIRDDLHCNAVRVSGGDPDRLEIAAGLAADLGLEVWFSPFTPIDITRDEMLALLADCAERAERIRRQGAEVVLVTGGELSLLIPGFLPGDTIDERMKLLDQPERLRELFAQMPPRMNDFLGKAVAVVRERFGGKVTYAAIQFEGVDWPPFDFVSVDLYRTAEIADRFRDGVRALVAQGKPLAITEFGTATFRGAGDMGASVIGIVEWDAAGVTPLGLNGDYDRDEEGQADHLRELLEVFETEGVDSAFVFTFAQHAFPHRPDANPRADLDRASLGIVKMLEDRLGDTYPDMPWEPKPAFTALADFYRDR